MTYAVNRQILPRLSRAILVTLCVAAALSAVAGPGAHGPNGEHLDAPAPYTAGAIVPRLETHSETFELVATLGATELTVLIDRYASNEPVLNAALEVEVDGIKRRATFHADHGDYVFDDPQLLAALGRPGEHALVFTLMADRDHDLLDGTLVTPPPRTTPATQTHGAIAHGHPAVPVGAAIAALAGLAMLIGWRLRRRKSPLQRSA